MDAASLLLAAGVALAGVVVGAGVQKKARFIYPYDCFTICIALVIIADLALGLSGIDAVWYASFALGYAVGYLIVGRTAYMMIWETDLATKTVRLHPWVVWNEDGHQYMQEQTNRALLRRLVCGVKHEILSNVPLDDDWETETKYPAFPLFRRAAVVAEDVKTYWKPVHWFWRISVKQYVTEVTLAYGSMASKMELVQDAESLKRLQTQNNRLIAHIRELEAQQGPALMEAALKLEISKQKVSPMNRMYDLLKRQPDGGEKPEKGKEEPVVYQDMKTLDEMKKKRKEGEMSGSSEDVGRGPEIKP